MRRTGRAIVHGRSRTEPWRSCCSGGRSRASSPHPRRSPPASTTCRAREDLTTAVRAGQLHPEADGEEALRLYTVLLSGLISQQLANQPDAQFATGAFAP
jgi:hypothetical protein